MKFISIRNARILAITLTTLNIILAVYLIYTNEFSMPILGLLLIFQFLVFIFYFLVKVHLHWKRIENKRASKFQKLSTDFVNLVDSVKGIDKRIVSKASLEEILFKVHGATKENFETAISNNNEHIQIFIENAVKIGNQAVRDYINTSIENVNTSIEGISTSIENIFDATKDNFKTAISNNNEHTGALIENAIKLGNQAVREYINTSIENIFDPTIKLLEQKFEDQTEHMQKGMTKSLDRQKEALKKSDIDTREELFTRLTNFIEGQNKNGAKRNTQSTKQIQGEINALYERLDAMNSIYNLITPIKPLPVMGNWAISSDFGLLLLSIMLEKKNGNVIDIGSGISTILCGYAVKKNGSGKVISLEHDEDYYNKSKKLIAEHELEDYVELYYAPLIEYIIQDKKWLWYDISNIEFPDNVTLVSIDGPPGNTQELARFPAIPLLKKYLNDKTTVILDDGFRNDEKLSAAKWVENFGFHSEIIQNHKGAILLNSSNTSVQNK